MLLDLVTIICSITETLIMKYNVFPCINFGLFIIVYSITVW